MNIVFFAHPDFLGHQSMSRLAKMQAEGMKMRGHTVEVWSPVPLFFRLPVMKKLRKWLGYIDQYIVFPFEVRRRLQKCSPNTLFVFTDQALGPWVPLVGKRPHVIHCNDLLAQFSALKKIPQHSTGWSGRQYQAFIRRGLSYGQQFISISEKTRADLHELISINSKCSEVAYLGLNQSFSTINVMEARTSLSKRIEIELYSGYFLHVGGNQWYKNRIGVIEIYNAWRKESNDKFPLLLIGETPSQKIYQIYKQSPFKEDIYFLSGIEDKIVRLAYAGASAFLFPSIAEGFGWPIAEAMASGCPVITTNAAPMTEVAGDAGFFIPRYPHKESEKMDWAFKASSVIDKVLKLSPKERKDSIEAGLKNVRRFDPQTTLDKYESIYKNTLTRNL